MQFRQCSINGVKYEEVGGLLCECSSLGAQPAPVVVFNVSILVQIEYLAHRYKNNGRPVLLYVTKYCI